MGGERVVGKWASRLAATKERGGEGGCRQIEPLGGGRISKGQHCDGQHNNGKGQHGDGQHAIGKGQQGNRRHNDGNGRHNDGNGRRDNEARGWRQAAQ